MNIEEISERINGLDGKLPPKVRDALRKSKERGYLPSLATLIAAAKAKDTSIAYLIGEVDIPKASELSKISQAASLPDQKSGQTLRVLVSRMNAVEDVASGRVAVSLDAETERGEPLDEAKLLLTYEAAVRGYRALARAVDRLEDSTSLTHTDSLF